MCVCFYSTLNMKNFVQVPTQIIISRVLSEWRFTHEKQTWVHFYKILTPCWLTFTCNLALLFGMFSSQLTRSSKGIGWGYLRWESGCFTRFHECFQSTIQQVLKWRQCRPFGFYCPFSLKFRTGYQRHPFVSKNSDQTFCLDNLTLFIEVIRH